MITDQKKLTFVMAWRLNDWEFYKRRNEALARELSRRNVVESVLHIEYVSLKGLIYKMGQVMKMKDRNMKDVYLAHVRKGFSLKPVLAQKATKLYIYSIVQLYTGNYWFLNKLNKLILRIQYNAVNKYLNKTKTNVVLIAYPPSQYLPDAIKNIKHDLLIADLVDDNINKTQDEKKRNRLEENYRDVLRNCQLIFSTSPSFNREYKKYTHKDIYFLPNAVDIKDFSTDSQKKNFLRERKTIGYIGILNTEVDLELLEYIIDRNLHADFVLIGKATNSCLKDINRLSEKYKNLYYLGEKCHKEIPALMENFDVLINFKKTDYSTAGAESIKTYEYLATGRPIVSTLMPPANRFTDVIYVASDKFQFAELLKMALEEDNEELRQKRIKAAVDNTWTKRVDVILDKVSPLL